VTELWACPACARTFANRNQTHTCAPPGDLARRVDEVDGEFVAWLDGAYRVGSQEHPPRGGGSAR
jgi:hypothetical protein